jgi:hypothetical protein
MNERIRELLIEAREVTKEGNWKPPTHVWADKFAELIIKDCVNACEKNSWTTLDAFQRSAQIKEHFGVEE